MTDASDILAALCDDPESVILAAMLTDALMEERGMLRSEADRHVCRVIQDARDLLDISAAATIMTAGDGRRYRVLDAMMLAIWPNEVPPSFSWIIVGGDDEPCRMLTASSEDGPYPFEWVLKVGARWIIKKAGRAPHPATKPARRRRG